MVRRRAALLGAVVLGVSLLGPAPAASAHAYLTSTAPADGDTLQQSPPQLRLAFSESVQLASTRITVLDAAGAEQVLSGLRLVRSPAAGTGAGEATRPDAQAPTTGGPVDSEHPVSVVAPLPSLAAGAYRVVWETLSTDDLHRTAGVLAFGVRDAVVAAGPTESVPEWPAVLGRWLLLGALALAFGGALVASVLLPALGDGARRVRVRRQLLRLASAGAVAALVASFTLLVVELGGSGAGALTTAYAVKWAVRGVGLVALVAGLRLGASQRGSTVARLLVLLGATTASVGTVLLGHAGLRGGASWVAASALHLASGATWAGAVGVLALLLVRHGSAGLEREQVLCLLRAFRRPAGVLVTVVAVTGAYLASDVVGSVDAAILTAYGRALLAKTAVVLVVGLLALRTTRRLRRPGTRRPAPAVVVEAAALAAVLGLAGFLASGQPAVQPQLVASSAAPSVLLDRTVGDLQESVVISPNRAGRTMVLVTVHDTRRPAPAPVRAVDVRVLGSAGPLAATRVDEGRWSVPVDLAASGTVPVEVRVRRTGMPDTVASYAWTLAGPGDERHPLVSSAPLSGPLRLASAVLLLGAGLGWWLELQRRRSRGRGSQSRATRAAVGRRLTRP
ncbi:MAG TPA: copper resistance protein CopC [Intrasporangium sp.]|uniref:copper resistance CopC/CopD family protein n=1 Tax=Intrasporangium sp. TaxID=1925024 RepID=UPI002D76B393|nr:copper resistance protein CopC [Intrasporangium sp.]HET7398543.1 copper resistance protein CopC [Intrasporangium sp.]